MTNTNSNFDAYLLGGTLSSNSKKAYTFLETGFYGEKREEKIEYSLFEGMFLFRKKNLKVHFNKNLLKENELITKFSKIDKNFFPKYQVYEDLRKKGFILKSGIKYGADFSVYDKGKKPSKAHSSWLLSIRHHNEKLKWEDFISKNRIANSTRKKILLAILDREGHILYYEVDWKRFN